jgi:hypothetical protein
VVNYQADSKQKVFKNVCSGETNTVALVEERRLPTIACEKQRETELVVEESAGSTVQQPPLNCKRLLVKRLELHEHPCNNEKLVTF